MKVSVSVKVKSVRWELEEKCLFVWESKSVRLSEIQKCLFVFDPRCVHVCVSKLSFCL